MKELLKRTIVPLSTALILSSCLILAWHLYQTVYNPLFNEVIVTPKDQDYAISQTKLESTLEALSKKTTKPEAVLVTRNPFIRSTEE